MKITKMKGSVIVTIATLLFSTVSHADAATDQELGKNYLYCGMLHTLISQAEKGDNQSGMLMLALGSQLLGKTTLEEIKPEIELAKQKLDRGAEAATNKQLYMFTQLSDCVTLGNKNNPELVNRFKDPLSNNVVNPK